MRYIQFNNDQKCKLTRLTKSAVRLTLILSVIWSSGCASSCDSFSCGTTNCSYCPPQPVRFSTVEKCSCQDSIGQFYLAKLFAAQELSEPHSSQIVSGNTQNISETQSNRATRLENFSVSNSNEENVLD